MAHIANGDMVTMVDSSVVNAFAMFLARVLAFAISQAMRSRDDDRGGSYLSNTSWFNSSIRFVLRAGFDCRLLVFAAARVPC